MKKYLILLAAIMLAATEIHALTGEEAVGRMQACMNGIKTMRGVISWSHS
jgi:hypothetical protein